MGQDEVEVVLLIRGSKVCRAVAPNDRVRRTAGPPLDRFERGAVRRLEPAIKQARRDPGATEHILVPELAAGAGPDQGNIRRNFGEVTNKSAAVAQAPDVHRAAG